MSSPGKIAAASAGEVQGAAKKGAGGSPLREYGRTSGLKSNGSLQCAVAAERKSRPSLGQIYAWHKREKGAESEQPEMMQKKEKKAIQAKAAV